MCLPPRCALKAIAPGNRFSDVACPMDSAARFIHSRTSRRTLRSTIGACLPLLHRPWIAPIPLVSLAPLRGGSLKERRRAFRPPLRRRWGNIGRQPRAPRARNTTVSRSGPRVSRVPLAHRPVPDPRRPDPPSVGAIGWIRRGRRAPGGPVVGHPHRGRGGGTVRVNGKGVGVCQTQDRATRDGSSPPGPGSALSS